MRAVLLIEFITFNAQYLVDAVDILMQLGFQLEYQVKFYTDKILSGTMDRLSPSDLPRHRDNLGFILRRRESELNQQLLFSSKKLVRIDSHSFRTQVTNSDGTRNIFIYFRDEGNGR